MELYKIDFELMRWQEPADGVRFKAYQQGGKRIRLAEFSKEFVEAEWCRKGHIGFLLEGRMEIDFNGKVIVFKAGDGLFIPTGEEHKHKARVLTDTVKIFLVEDAS